MVKCLDNYHIKLEMWNKFVVELQSVTLEVIASMRETRVELNCWRDKAEAMWHQRSRLSWIQSGDKNSSFFLSKASTRFQKNYIEGIMGPNREGGAQILF